jgi:deoxyribodipyrimidine photo-lyase
MSDLILFWHRRDLRLTDNVGLAIARQQSANVVGLFCFDPNLLQRDDIAPARIAYLLGCLQDLHQRYAQIGSQLLILHTDPVLGIPRLAAALAATAVFWNWDVEPYAQIRDHQMIAALKSQNILARTFWDQLMHNPTEIKSGSGTPYTVYTPFWKTWSSREKAEPVADLTNAIGLTEPELATATQAGARPLPTLKELGLAWAHPLLLQPGAAAARQQLDEFCRSAIEEYQEQRNFPAHAGTSQLSAALKFGAIGIRTVWAVTIDSLAHSRSDEAQASIQTWRQELAWREFYQHVLYHFPELAEGAYRDHMKDFPWHDNDDHFQAWCTGRTGYPIVDAAMRQLNETGWMHNRCRMIVANFLTKDLFIDWRKGEKYFMQTLYDGDLAANNGGWQWSASSGMDARPLRIFNPASQAQKFDPAADYMREWLPELRSVETEDLITGKISSPERDRCGYPEPIVDHHQQQQRFKERYQQQKNKWASN